MSATVVFLAVIAVALLLYGVIAALGVLFGLTCIFNALFDPDSRLRFVSEPVSCWTVGMSTVWINGSLRVTTVHFLPGIAVKIVEWR